MKYFLPLLLILLFSTSKCSNTNNLAIKSLHCEYLENPLGIDIETPRLSWKTQTNNDNIQQKAWQVLVSSDKAKLENNEGDLWDTDTVFSNQSTQIKYAGKALHSGQKAYWKVRIWDQNDNVSQWSKIATWEMALLNQSDWKAKWIGDKDFIKPELGQANPALYLRKSFEIKDIPENARVYISGLGYYELYINGKKVGDHVLSPNQTNYDKKQAEFFENTSMANGDSR
ncbi:MAG: hypothetical protein DRJ10_19215, partial [Bacteroidetes bacterium]